MSYLSYFNFTVEPFGHAPSDRLYYASSQHTDALGRLMHAVSAMRGLAVLVGDIGRGKTTLARRLLDALPEEEYEAAMLVIVHSAVGPDWLVRRIALQLGVAEPADDKLAMLSQLYNRLVEIHKAGKKAVVIIDEAQMLQTREMMEEFRGLLNLEVPGHKLITFVFFGLPELEAHMRLDPPLAQRVALRYELGGLVEDDTRAYVRHRLHLAGSDREIFTDDALRAVHQYTNGVPRLINTLCDNVLLEVFFARKTVADGETVVHVARNLAPGAPTEAAVPRADPAADVPVVPTPSAAIAASPEPAGPSGPRFKGRIPPPSLSEEADAIAHLVALEADDDLSGGAVGSVAGIQGVERAHAIMSHAPAFRAEETIDTSGPSWAGVQAAAPFLGNDFLPAVGDAPAPVRVDVVLPEYAPEEPPAPRPPATNAVPAVEAAPPPAPKPPLGPKPAVALPRPRAKAVDLDEVDDLLASLTKKASP